MKANDLAWAAFRTALISPLLTGEIQQGEREAYLQSVANEERLFPNGQRGKVSVRTLWRWYQRMNQGGWQAMAKQPRSDRGQPRKHLRARIERAVALKREQPLRSDQPINTVLKHELGRGVPRSTLYRHLRLQGATRKQLGIASKKVRCRWTSDRPNALWQGDFEHGPIVLHRGQARQTRLSGWIDSHSRYIVAARYYFNENTDCLVDSLLRAWGLHGSSVRLYVDNGKVYHSQALTVACGQLLTKKLHRPPGEPEPGGLIERFIQTIQLQFESEIRATQIGSFDDLNRAFAAWLDRAYHQSVHSETGQSPHARYFTELKIHRPVDVASIAPIFFRSEPRTVDATHLDVALNNAYYQVDRKFRDMRLEVRFDPFTGQDQPPPTVELFNELGVYVGLGRLYQRELGAHGPQPEPPKKQPLERSVYLDALIAEHERSQRSAREQGIDFHSAMKHGQMTSQTLCQCVAKLLGRKGGLSSLHADEIEALQNLHRNHPHVQPSHVRTAAGRATSASFAPVLWELQCLLAERKGDR